MVAYFKLQNNLCMLLGALLGLAVSLLSYGGIRANMGRADVFLIALYMFIGIVVGRIVAGRLANVRLSRMTALLYREGKAEEFVRRFGPVADRVPKQTVEYVDGQVKLAFAYEAMGEFDKGLSLVNALKPRELKLHMLAGTAITENQKLRLYLMKEDPEAAGRQLAVLKDLREEASGRASALERNLEQCVRLAESWLGFLKGEDYDAAYIREEMELATNPVHKGEMLLLLARMREKEQDLEEAAALYRKARAAGNGLYASREAARRLEGLEKVGTQ